MPLSFNQAAKKIGAPSAKLLLKLYLAEPAALTATTLIDIASSYLKDEAQQRQIAREFEEIGDKIVRQILPLFNEVSENAADAISYELQLTLENNISENLLVSKDLDPSLISGTLREKRPLPTNTFSTAEHALYDRALDETIRYITGIALNLPKLQVSAIATTLSRLSKIGGQLDLTIKSIAQIERLVGGSESAQGRYEADFRQAVQQKFDYLELFGADISPEAQRHSLSVGYISLNFTAHGTSDAVHSANKLFSLLAAGSGRLLLRGDAGSGKSTLLRWMAIQAATGVMQNNQSAKLIVAP